MNPKEKAKELVFKYEQYKWINHDLAKQCALIAVDEIIKVLQHADTAYDLLIYIDYWIKVKEEIEKL
ncbi:MAG TPA: hypothetical protein V6C58_04130 [Allocoleopsis sp.]